MANTSGCIENPKQTAWLTLGGALGAGFSGCCFAEEGAAAFGPPCALPLLLRLFERTWRWLAAAPLAVPLAELSDLASCEADRGGCCCLSGLLPDWALLLALICSAGL